MKVKHSCNFVYTNGKKKKYNIVQVNLAMEDFMDEVSKQAQVLCEHHFIKNSHPANLKHQKTMHWYSQTLLLTQDVIKEYQWKNSQETVHPFIVYKMEKQILTIESFCLISDHMKHNSNYSSLF